MKSNVAAAPVATEEQASASALPARVQEALGELVGAAQEGLLALSVGVGLGVLHELMEEELDEVVGPKGRHDPDRSAHRHGREAGSVTLGGRRMPVSRPRARTADGAAEVALGTYAHFAARGPLTAVVLERMLAGVSTRRFARVAEPVGEHGEAGGALDVEVGGLARVRRAHARDARRADGSSPRRRPPGGADARRDRPQGPHERRGAGDHDRRGEDPAWALGGLDGERGGGLRALGRSLRPRP